MSRTKIQETREANGWSRAELARRSKMNAATISLIESGRLRPYPGQVEKLAKALKLTRAERRRAAEEIPPALGAGCAVKDTNRAARGL